MSRRITPTSWQTLVRIFEADGFTFERARGSHCSFIKPGVMRPLVIPRYAEVGVDIILSNMRTAGMSRDRYLELFDRFR